MELLSLARAGRAELADRKPHAVEVLAVLAHRRLLLACLHAFRTVAASRLQRVVPDAAPMTMQTPR